MRNTENPFETFYRNPVYLEFKNHLYNYQLRRRAIRDALKSAPQNGLILEIGSGVSTMADGLGKVLFSDISMEAMRCLKDRETKPLTAAMSVTDIAIQNEKIDSLVCSEVLEHVPDDRRALYEFSRILKPGGLLVLTVPAHPRYFGTDDIFVEHQRRYKIWPFLKQIRKAGFNQVKIVKITGLLDKLAMVTLTTLYPLFALRGKKKKAAKDSGLRILLLRGLLPFYITLNWIFALFVTLEARLMPLSTTAVIMVTARKT